MIFNLDDEKFSNNQAKNKKYYKNSLIFGIIGFLVFVLSAFVPQTYSFMDKLIGLIGLIGGICFFNLFICFIIFCQKQKENYIIVNANLFVENDVLHYHTLYDPPLIINGTLTDSQTKSTKQYRIKDISSYMITDKNIAIYGNIEYSKDGSSNYRTINNINIPNYFKPQDKLIEFLEKKKIIK